MADRSYLLAEGQAAACSSLESVHEQIGSRRPLVLVDQRHQSPEMLGVAVCIQGRPVRPLLDEDEMPRIFLIDVQIVRNAQRLLSGSLDKLSIERGHGIEVFDLDEVLRNHFQHVVVPGVIVCVRRRARWPEQEERAQFLRRDLEADTRR